MANNSKGKKQIRSAVSNALFQGASREQIRQDNMRPGQVPLWVCEACESDAVYTDTDEPKYVKCVDCGHYTRKESPFSEWEYLPGPKDAIKDMVKGAARTAWKHFGWG